MNILILNPPCHDDTIMVKEGRCMQRKGAWGYVMSPSTMVIIATLLRNCDHFVTVLDAPAEGVNFTAMLEIARQTAPDIVFINTSTPTIAEDISAAKNIKEQNNRRIFTVLFGIHPSCQYQEILHSSTGIDCCILGEPEYTARDFSDAVSNGRDLRSVSGIAFLDMSLKMVVTTPRKPIEFLDDLPIPDWSFINTDSYRLPLNNEKFLLVNTNRGCPYRCTFCNAHIYYGRTPRHRSVESIMQELNNNVIKFGVTNFMFWAEEFILDNEFVVDLCTAIIHSGLQIKWVCNSRVDAVNLAVLNAIKLAGCWNIAFGIESGDQNILNSISKQTTIGQIENAVLLAKSVGLQVTGHVIIGFPDDTDHTIATTEKLINSLDLDFVQYYCAMPYPGTQLYADALEHGWLTSTDWRKWEHNNSVLNGKQLTAEQTMKLRRQLMLKWYFTPKNISNTLQNHIKSPSHLLAFISKLYGFIRWM